MGARFARLLDAPTENFDAELTPAAVVIGIFAQLRERLSGCLGPRFGEGGFPTGDFETIRYRPVMLLFGGGGPWDGGHWMGLANWKPGDYRRRMGRKP